LKVATVIGSAIGVALYTINPNIVIALIVSAPGIMTAILAILTRIDNKRAELERAKNELARSIDHAVTMGVINTVAKQTDGINTKLFAEKTQLESDKAIQATQLSETAQKLAHVEGHEEGRQAGVASEIDREPPEVKG
jgi:hypothetical protein